VSQLDHELRERLRRTKDASVPAVEAIPFLRCMLVFSRSASVCLLV